MRAFFPSAFFIYCHFSFDALINGSILCLKYVFFFLFSMFQFIRWETGIIWHTAIPWFARFYELNKSACISIPMANNPFSFARHENTTDTAKKTGKKYIKHLTPLKPNLFKYLRFFKHLNC